MIFKLNLDINEHNLKSGERGYGEEFSKNGKKYYRVKFLKNSLHEDIVLSLEQEKLTVIDDSVAGVDILYGLN